MCLTFTNVSMSESDSKRSLVSHLPPENKKIKTLAYDKKYLSPKSYFLHHKIASYIAIN